MLTHQMIEEVAEKFGGIGLGKQAKSNAEVRASESRPINVRLQDKVVAKVALKPRRYQVELYERALKENVIVYLGTGLGKTFISVLLLKSPQFDDQIRLGKKVVFLAPTQDLVKQQAEYIAYQVPYKVKVYCGRTCNAGNHIDNWRKSDWDSELAKIDIFFMTPAILSAALAINVLSWANFSLVIFDEAHHAATSKRERAGKKAGHPYSQSLVHYREMFASTGAPKPRIVGLTASLINNMPKDETCIQANVLDLERKLYAKCITDLTAIESKPQVIIHSFNKPTVDKDNDTILNLMYSYAKRMEEVLALDEARKIPDVGPRTDDQKEVLAYHNRLRLASSGFSIKPKSLHKVLKQLAAIRTNSGIWTMSNICFNLVNAMSKHSLHSNLSKDIAPVYTEFASILMKIIFAINNLVGQDGRKLLFDFTQPKLMCLLDVLSSEYKRVQVQKAHGQAIDPQGREREFSCIVFVKSRVEVIAICGWLKLVNKLIPGYDFIKADYAIGMAATMGSKWACITRRKPTEQSCMLEDFRRNRLNVIVTTSVLEEGIDLPVCSTVIRYDSADTFRVYVQSRGRARMVNSTYITLCESEKKIETELNLNKFNDFEERIKGLLSNKDSAQPHTVRPSGDRPPNRGELDFFKDEARGIYIRADTARVILHMYCARLSRRCPYSDGFLYERKQVDSIYYQTTLFFPPGCPCKDSVMGGIRSTIELADSSAIIAAYRALYESGELDEHGVPIRATEEHIDGILDDKSLKPNFEPLDKDLLGEVQTIGETEYYSYPWEISRMKSNLLDGYSSRTYKLYRVNFIANADQDVRQDARGFFEHSIFGLVVDAKADYHQWPDKLHSHYGAYKVDYKLIDDNLKIDLYQTHKSYLDFTFNLVTNFWNLRGLRKDEFKQKCMFYLVPLNENDEVDHSSLTDAFYPLRGDIRQGDIVRLRYNYRGSRDSAQRFMVKAVRYDMSPSSLVPGTRAESFTQQMYERYHEHIRDLRQPVIEVCPIAKAHATIKLAKKVKSDYSTRNVYYLSQCLEAIKCDAYIAYQAHNLPEIVYRLYLTELAARLTDRFIRDTANNRRNLVLPPKALPTDEVVESDDGDHSCSSHSTNSEEANSMELASQDEADLLDDEDIDSERSVDSYSDDSDSYGTDDESDSSEGPRPSRTYLDILSKQTLNLNERDKSGLEKWDLSEYNVANLKTMPIQHHDSYHHGSFVDSQPGSTTSGLLGDTIGHLLNIEDILRKFKQGIMGDCELEDDNEVLSRSGGRVDPSIEAPLKFDRPGKPLRELPPQLGFVEALTQRRAGERCNLEALENIGDSYIKYCISVVLFKHLGHNEGLLTSARSRLVGNKHFTHLARMRGLGFYAITKEFSAETLETILGAGQTCVNVMRAKDLADMVESLVGSCLVYQGEYEAIMALKWLGMDHIFRDDTFAELHENGVAFARSETALIESDDQLASEYLRKCKGRVQRFEEIINYKFSDSSYLVQAFTHATAPMRCTDSYERLEFLGDAVLDFLVTMTLYDAGLNKDPGQITQSRSAVVNNCTFAELALEYKYDVYLQHGNQELFDELNRVNEFFKNNKTLKLHETAEFDRIIKVMGDLFESVAGAIYLDSGCSLDTVYGVYYPMMKKIIDKEIESPTKNIVMRLCELFPGKDRVKFDYFKTDSGDEGACRTTAKCTVYGLGEFYGEGLSNWAAKQRAAADAMENLPSEGVKQKLDAEYKRLMVERMKSMRPDRPPRAAGRGRGNAPWRGRGYSSGGNSSAPRRPNFSRHTSGRPNRAP